MDFFIIHFQVFMLIFSRLTGLIMVAPFFSSGTITTRSKLALCFLITGVIFPLVYEYAPDIPSDIFQYILTGIIEALIGIAIGFCIRISFAAFQLAGQFFTVQMGFGASEVFDPMSQLSLPLMGQFLYLIAILLFVVLRGPMLIIQEIYYSYEIINATIFLKGSIIHEKYGMLPLFGNMLNIALRISIPIVGTLLLISVTMGLLAKAAPQMNLLLIGFPISITVAFLIIILLLPGLIIFFREFIDEIFKKIWLLMLELENG